LRIDAWRYGLLTAAAGVGAGMSAMILAGMKIAARTYRRILPIGLTVFAVALAGFAASRTVGLSLIVLWASGCGGIFYLHTANTHVQLGIEDVYRGRVVSLYALMHQGTATFGSLVLGFVAEKYGTPAALLSGAAVCLAAAVWYVGRLAFATSAVTAPAP